jgi:arabinofuranan 3-O-arabinosyltransferase
VTAVAGAAVETPRSPATTTAPSRLVDRIRLLTGAVVLVAVAFSQQPGFVVPDTKLDLVVDPGRFLARALQAWDPQASFGQLQNQAYGYLFPMGPFFWAGHAAGLPAWVVQRLWWAALLVVAYAGFVRLARSLGLGGPDATLLAGLAYALGPRVVTELGGISVELLPLAVLPWVVVPLVRGYAGAPGTSLRRAAAWSGLAVACIGGVNAAATAAVLVVPLVWLLTRPAGRRAWRLTAWWLGAVALATAWWVLPLLVLGRYAYPFLSLIENATVTTSVDSATNVLRGTDHWQGFLVGTSGPVWPGGWTLATSAVPAAATVLVAGLGLSGLAVRRLPDRRFLGWSLLVGLLLVGIGYAGVGGSPVAGAVHGLLDRVLAPLRNVHKFDPVLRLPLTLGLAVTLSRAPAVGRRFAARLRGPDGRWLRAHPAVAPRVAVGLVLAPLLLATAPAWTGALAPPGSFVAIPQWWYQTADWLAAHGDGRALLEPASAFADYTWGRPGDEPLQALARSPWVVRDAVPLGAPGATRLLDGVESVVAGGRGSTDLAAALQRAGIRYVVLRNDLAPGASATPPVVARATLVNSPGISRVAAYGPEVSPAFWVGGASEGLPSAPAVEIFAVGSVARGAQLFTAGRVGLSGGPEALAGTIAADPAVPYVAIADGGPADELLGTDTLRRRVRNMGAAASDAYSPTLPAGTEPRTRGPAADVLPYSGVVHQTTSALDGARNLVTSSSAADPFAHFFLGPAYSGYSAVDGDVATAWVSDAGDARPSLRLDLSAAVDLRGLTLDVGAIRAGVARPASLSVRTQAGQWSAPVSADRVRLPQVVGLTSWVEVQMEAAGGSRPPLGLAEVEGLPPIARTLVAPADSGSAGPASTWAFVRSPDARRACVDPGPAWVCSAGLARSTEETGAFDRTFTSGTPAQVVTAATAVPVQGPALDGLLDLAAGLVVSGSSALVPDAADRPGAALDGDPATAWITAAGDAAPRLRIDYGHPVTVSGLTLTAPRASRDRVLGAVVRGDDASQSRTVELTGPGAAAFPPLTTRTLTITLRLRPVDVDAQGPLAIAEIALDGAPVVTGTTVSLPCGFGPTVELDDAVVTTALHATRDALLSGSALPLTICSGGSRALAQGTHRLVGPTTTELAVESVTLAPAAPSAAPPSVSLGATTWDPERRVVSVPATPDGGSLVLDEGYNAGWAAVLDGAPLTPVRVDGWRQGWIVPAGTSAGTATLTFEPGNLHRTGLLAGAAALVLLLAAALLPARRRDPDPPSRGVADAALLPSALGSGLVTLAAAVLLAGPVGAVGWVAGVAAARRVAVASILAGAVILAAIVAAVTSAGRALVVDGGVPWWLQALAQALSVALVVAALAVRPGTRPSRPGRVSRSRSGGARAAAAAPPEPSTTP